MNFADSSYFYWGISSLPVIIILIIMGFLRKKNRLLKIMNHSLILKLGFHSFHPAMLTLKFFALSGVWISLWIGLACPLGKDIHEKTTLEGWDIVVALDISASMAATDIKPNRLEGAKRAISDLMQELKGDRIGLVIFAGEAITLCPLTTDYSMMDSFLHELSREYIGHEGTNIGRALEVSMEALSWGGTAGGEGQAIILMTDGEDQEDQAHSWAQKAKDLGVKIYTFGIGHPSGAPIPESDGGLKKDSKGQIILSRLDEKFLKDISEKTGGYYVNSWEKPMDLPKIYRHARASKEVSHFRAEKNFRPWILGAIFLWTLDVFLPHSLPKKILFPFFFSWIVQGSPSLEKTRDAFLEKEIENPESSYFSHERAFQDYRLGRYKEAAQGFLKATRTKNPFLGQTWYNLGNAYAQMEAWDEAIKAYEETLKILPKDKETLENLEWVKNKKKSCSCNKKNKNSSSNDKTQNDGKKEGKNQSSKKDERDSKLKEEENKEPPSKESTEKAKQDEPKKNSQNSEPSQTKEESSHNKGDNQGQELRGGKEKDDISGGKKDWTKAEAERLLKVWEGQVPAGTNLHKQQKSSASWKKGGKDW